MNKDNDNLDYIDLLVAFIKGELNPELHTDIENTISKDAILSATMDGMKKLLQDHQGNKAALKKYLKNTQQKTSENLFGS